MSVRVMVPSYVNLNGQGTDPHGTHALRDPKSHNMSAVKFCALPHLVHVITRSR